jgi:hypothetical protein
MQVRRNCLGHLLVALSQSGSRNGFDRILAAIRVLPDWLATDHVIPLNPAAAILGAYIFFLGY